MTVEEKFKATAILDKALTNIESDNSSMIIAVRDNDDEGSIMMTGSEYPLLIMVAAMIDNLLGGMSIDEYASASLILTDVIRKARYKE